MRVGTKSLLFGVHQFIWHPVTVLIAWIKLYGLPNWRELICIINHDWGYWGSPNMDGEEGEKHPALAASLASRLLGHDYFLLCLLHSRHYARQFNMEPSKLCWADKLSILYDPERFYLFRANLSGEIKEYRNLANAAGFIPLTASDHRWFIWIREKFAKLAREMRGDAIPYMNQSHERRVSNSD